MRNWEKASRWKLKFKKKEKERGKTGRSGYIKD